MCPSDRAIAKAVLVGMYRTSARASARAEKKKVRKATAKVATEKGPTHRKRVQRVKHSWHADDPLQLSVSKGEFLNICIDSASDQGWIFAERTSTTHGAAQAGWLPTHVLRSLLEDHHWMRTARAWQGTDDSQCAVGLGVLVLVSECTSKGWAYVKSAERAGIRPGWLPAP